jgi:hypothetical protein
MTEEEKCIKELKFIFLEYYKNRLLAIKNNTMEQCGGILSRQLDKSVKESCARYNLIKYPIRLSELIEYGKKESGYND